MRSKHFKLLICRRKSTEEKRKERERTDLYAYKARIIFAYFVFQQRQHIYKYWKGCVHYSDINCKLLLCPLHCHRYKQDEIWFRELLRMMAEEKGRKESRVCSCWLSFPPGSLTHWIFSLVDILRMSETCWWAVPQLLDPILEHFTNTDFGSVLNYRLWSWYKFVSCISKWLKVYILFLNIFTENETAGWHNCKESS